MQRLLDGNDSGEVYNLAISGATFYEFLDQLTHTLTDIKVKIPHLLGNHRFNNESAEMLVTSEKMRQELSLLTEQGFNQTILNPIKNFTSLLENGVIRGIGDIIGNTPTELLKQYSGLFETLIEDQSQLRKNDHTTRPFDDSIFHYKVDAANICLSVLCNQQVNIPIYFHTGTHFNLQKCQHQNIPLGRLDRVPLFLKNSNYLKSINYISDEKKFLQDGLRLLSNIKSEIIFYNEMIKLPKLLLKKILDFYEEYVGPLSRSKPDEIDSQSMQNSIEDIRLVLSDKKRVREILDIATEQIKSSAQKMFDIYSGSIDISYINHFKFEEDPIVKKIKSELSIR